jgi:hypothetical protein
VGANHNWSDVIKLHWSFGLSLLEWYQSTHFQVIWYRARVECIRYLNDDFILQLGVVLHHIAIETVRTQFFVVITAPNG